MLSGAKTSEFDTKLVTKKHMLHDERSFKLLYFIPAEQTQQPKRQASYLSAPQCG
jgi:hypothetical protein